MTEIKPPEFSPPALPTTAPQPKMRKPSPKVREAIALLCEGRVKTVTAAAQRVGLTRERLSRAIGQHQNYYERKVRRAVLLHTARAGVRIGELVDSDSEHVSLDATKHLLGILGIAPTPGASVNVNVELKAGYVIDLSEPHIDMKVVGGTVIDAKPEPIRGLAPDWKGKP